MADLVPDTTQQSVCELNCRIIHVPVGDASRGQSSQGIPPLTVPFESPRLAVKATAPQVIVDGPVHEGDGWRSQAPPQESASLATQASAALRAAAAAVSQGLPLRSLAGLLAGEDPQAAGAGEDEALPPVAWHPRLKKLAAADGGGRVLVFDLDSPAAPPLVLVHELQRGITALEWRPHTGGTLAVGCSMGVCLWKLGCGGVLGAGKAGSGGWDAWMSFLRGPGGGAGGTGGAAAITSVAWSPDGLLLAGASGAAGLLGGGAVLVWDVAQGAPVCVRAGVSTIGLLRWSPCGSYMLAASTGASFFLWETHRWTCRRWSSAAGRVTSASWSPDGRVLVAAFARGDQLAALHLACPAPSLDAHLLPLDLPQLDAGGGGGNGEGLVEGMAWDPTGERLAVAVREGHPRLGGLVALYATRQAPVLSASLVGFLRAPPGPASPAAGPEHGARAPGQWGRRVLRFHPRFPQGALLAERRAAGAVSFYPMIFTP